MVDAKKPPYFSTYDEAKKYYRILARPGRPIQVREWNELQEQIQKQIERIGVHLFENGAQVLPGTEDAVTYRNNIGFIKLSFNSSVGLDEAAIKNLLLNKIVTSTSSSLGTQAKVIGYKIADTLQEVRLFVDYIRADTASGESTTFKPGQNIVTEEGLQYIIASPLTSVGVISGVFIKNSVYFFNGDFILVDEQALFIDPFDGAIQTNWNNTPTAKIGLTVIKTAISYVDDEELGDNASLSPNFGAPGADRLHIEALLEQKSFNAENSGNFIELLRISNGEVLSRVNRTEYSVLENTFARRTYDESGDYSVKDFPLTVLPFYNENDNRGVHSREEFQYDTQLKAEEASVKIFGVTGASVDPEAPTKWLPASSNEEFLRLCRSKLTLQIDPGKAYVKGYEIEKLSPTYVDIDKARQLRYQNNRLVSSNLGTFIYVTNVYGVPEIDSYKTIEIHRNRKTANNDITVNNKIGTARILAIEYFSGTHGDASAIYKLHLFDIKAEPGEILLQMKSIKGTGASFSADLVLEFSSLEGSVTTGGAASTTLTGNGTSFKNKSSQSLSQFDYIRIGNSNDSIVQVASDPATDTSVDITSSITLSNNLPIEFAYSSFQGLEDTKGLLFNLPEKFAYTIRGANSDNTPNDIRDTVFSVRKQFSATSNNAGVITISTGSAEEEFVPYSSNDYIVINTDTGDWLKLAAGSSYSSGTDTSGVQLITTTQVKIYTNNNNTPFYIIASVNKIGGDASAEKIKTLTSDIIISEANRSDLNNFNLGQADIFKIKKIIMAPNFATEPDPLEDVDITDRYLLDSGQRDYYYDIGSIYLKPSAAKPTGRIRVEFEYFTHSPQGSFFSVDSYPFRSIPGIPASIDYADIPFFTDSSGRTFNLRDCLDFRPRVNATGAFQNYINIPRSDIRVDFHHYLNRTDNLYLDLNGRFRVTKGVPDVLPLPPQEPGDGMSLYKLDLQAYTASPAECFKRKMDNRRYTMRDIGKIERRVTNLEYYTTLSLLEKEAKELDIKDSQGLDRFKNGFIVDNFTSHGIGNIQDPDYRCSVDISNQELRPSHPQDIVDMIELNQLQPNSVVRDQKRDENNYTRTGKLFTLAYSPKKFIEQDLASQVENVNPFAKFTFRGRLQLDPSTDTWRDTVTLPDVIVYDETAYLAAKAGVNPNQVIWGEWETNWSKTDIESTTRRDIVALGPRKPNRQHNTFWPQYVQYTTNNKITTTTQEIRKGISQSVVPKDVRTESLGKRIVATIAADYIRSRSVKISAKGFMPNAKLYAFFDDVAVSDSCIKINSNPQIIEQHPLIADSTGSLEFNFIIPAGKFKTGERIFKLTTSPTGKNLPQAATEGEAKYHAIGWIDHEEKTQLSIRQFEVVDKEVTAERLNVTVDQEETKSPVVKEDPIAQSFTVREKGGCFLLAVDVYFYTKDPLIPIKLQLRPLSDDGYPTIFLMPFGEVIKPASDVITNFYDPVQGTLSVTGNGDIAGYTNAPWDGSTANPIEIQRVTNASGRVITSSSPFSTTNPIADMIPTRFIFESPVYLKEGSDYAIVLLADSIDYQTWVSQAGPITERPGGVPIFGRNISDTNTVLGTNKPILSDNFLGGVFFRSSNGTTWNADQYIDMKFALHKAEFVTNDTAVIEFVNDELPTKLLARDPIETFAGSTKVRIRHNNHGHPAFSNPPARVVIKGVSATANGINVGLLTRDAGWPIEGVEFDSYIIDTNEIGTPGATSATLTGRCGGNVVTATENRSMDSMFFNSNVLSFPETSVNWSYSSTNGGNVSFADPNPRRLPFVVNPYKEMLPNSTISFTNPMTVSSKINENNSTDLIKGPSKVNTNEIGDRKSLRMKAVLRSTNPNLSPILDSDRLSVFTIANKINNPQGFGEYSINTNLDENQIVPTTRSPAISTTAGLIYFYTDTAGINRGKIQTNDESVAQHLSNLDIGKLITISGASHSSRNVTNVVVKEVNYSPNETVKCSVILDATFGGSAGNDSGNVTVIQKERFIDEIAPQGGSAAFKYISKQLTLTRQSTALRISFDANRHESHEIDLYYRILRADSRDILEDLNWIKAPFNIESNGVLINSTPNPNSSFDEMTEYTSIINSLPPFIGISVKIVGRGGNSSIPPRISNLKIIAIDE
jgi:hypothetical protein